MINVGIDDSVELFVFENMGMHTKIVFLWEILAKL